MVQYRVSYFGMVNIVKAIYVNQCTAAIKQLEQRSDLVVKNDFEYCLGLSVTQEGLAWTACWTGF